MIRLLQTGAGDGIKVNYRKGEDQCTIELPVSLIGAEPSKVALTVAGRRIEPIIPFNKRGFGRVRYSDIEDVLDGISDLYIQIE